ncbi:hypothetical protein OSTOST_03868, partial [Ostertagia ostertagi]
DARRPFRSLYHRRNQENAGSGVRRSRTPPKRNATYTEDQREGDFIVKRYRYDVLPSTLPCKSSSRDMNNNSSCSSGPAESNATRHPPRKKSRWDCVDGAGTRKDFTSHLRPGTSATTSPAPPLAPSFAGVAYPPPPPYSALPLAGSASFPPSYPHLSVATSMPNLSFCGEIWLKQCISTDEMATTSQPPLLPPESSRGKREGRSRPSKKKKKKKRRHSSESSSSGSSSNSSLNVGEYLRVEKKEMSTKYISRERQGLEKTIVEEIKTVTKKKKYRVTESKRSDVKSSGLQMISSDESVENADGAQVDEEKNKKGSATGKGAEKDKKFEVHRWSSSSTDSDGEQFHKKEKKTERLSASASLHESTTQPPTSLIVPPPPPPSVFMSPSFVGPQPLPQAEVLPQQPGPPPPVNVPVPHPALPVTLLPTHLPPPPFPIPHVNAPPLVGAPPFNPLLPPPPPGFPPPQPHIYPRREFPKVALRFVEDSPPCPPKSSAPSQQTLADRVASIFGSDVLLGSSKSTQGKSATPQPVESTSAACDDLDDMDVDVGSSMSPPPRPSTSQSPMQLRLKRRKRHRTEQDRSSDRDKRRFMKNVAIVREATEKVIGEEIVDVIKKDFYKRIESAQEALRAQAQIVTQEKPSDVSQLCSPLAASLNATPEKLGSFPFTINMPKLPSFKRVSRFAEPLTLKYRI